MGAVQNARTAVEVLTKSPGSVRSARTAVETITQQRGKVQQARQAIDVLTKQRGKVQLARTVVEVIIPNVVPLQFEWGVRWVVIPPMPTGLTVDLEAGISTALQTAGGSPAVADNDPVGVWRDKINNRDAVQTTAGARPLLKKAIYNGRDTLRFDGGDDQLVLPGDSVDLITNPTIFVVAKATSAGGRMMVAKSHTMSGWSSPYHRWGWYHNGSFYTNWNGVGTNTNTWSTGDLKVLELVDGDSYANGVKVTDGSDVDLAYPNGNTPILISGNGVGSERWHGDICRIMVFNRSLTVDERQTVRALLASTYAITLP